MKKKILISIVVCSLLLSFLARAQYVPMFSYQYKGLKADTLLIPTGSGAPTYSPDVRHHRAALYYDTTGANVYKYDPHTNLWSIIGSGTLSNTLTDGHIFVGNVSNIATDVDLTGDATITDAGVWTNTGLLTKPLPSLSTGFLKYNGSAWVFDNSTYLTGNQPITWTAAGDISGSASGTTSITPTLTVTGIRGASIPTLADGFLKQSGGGWIFDNSSYITNITSLISAGTNISITGTGTSSDPYIINAAGGGTLFGKNDILAGEVRHFDANAFNFSITGADTMTLSSDDVFLGEGVSKATLQAIDTTEVLSGNILNIAGVNNTNYGSASNFWGKNSSLGFKTDASALYANGLTFSSNIARKFVTIDTTNGKLNYSTFPTTVVSSLSGGSTGQVLKKNSSTDYDYSWANASGSAFWPLSGTGTLTGNDTIVSSVMNQLLFTGTPTTTANNQWWMKLAPNITEESVTNDIAIAMQLAPVFTNSSSRTGIALDIVPSNGSGFGTLVGIRTAGDIIPATNATYNLGSSAARWNSILFTGSITGPSYVSFTTPSAFTWTNSTGVPLRILNNTTSNEVQIGHTTTTTDSLYPLRVNGEIQAVGGINIVPIAQPVINSITQGGTAGSTTYTYKIVYRDVMGNATEASALATTNTGNATLTATNYNQINFTLPQGAYYIDLYRISGGATQGKVNTQAGFGKTFVIDNGTISGDGTTPPAINTTANLGIGTPRPQAALDVTSTTQGALLPRMTTTQRDAMTLTEGLIIYNLTAHKLQVYDGTIWQDAW